MKIRRRIVGGDENLTKREIEFRPAFDKRDPDPSKNYGIHGAEMLFVVSGKHGAAVLQIFTNWMLPSVQKEREQRERDGHPIPMSLLAPMPADIGYHSYVPMYEGQVGRHDCHYLNGRECYYDGSSIDAQRYFDILVSEGIEPLWTALEAYYHNRFSHLDKPEEPK